MKLRGSQGKQIKELKELPIEDLETDKAALLANENAYDLLEESIDELSAEQKQCVTLFYLKKCSYQQITEATGFTPMQVKSYIQNGKRNLRVMLERKLKNQHKN